MGALVIADGDGLTVLAAINTAMAQLGTQNAGNARPADAAAGTIWVDKNTPSATVWSLFIYDGATDTRIGLFNTTSDFFTPDNVALSEMMKGWVTGLTYANNSGDPTNDIDIAAGWCIDATAVWQMEVAALTKQSDVAWAVGSAAGGLDTGAVGNSDYYIWAIARSDTGVVDVLFSLSATAPTMPANYDYKRLIGWFKRSGGTIVAFKTYETAGGGLEFKWNVPTLDVDLAATLTTSRRTDAAKVPLNFSTEALLRVAVFDATTVPYTNICCPDETDAAIDGAAAPLQNFAATTGFAASGDLRVRTSAAGLVAARSSVATVDTYRFVTLGFVWSRR